MFRFVYFYTFTSPHCASCSDLLSRCSKYIILLLYITSLSKYRKSIADMTLSVIILVLAAVIPAVNLLIKVYKSDRIEPESPRILKDLIIAGVLAGIIAMIEEHVFVYILDLILNKGSVLYNFILTFLIVAVSEESSKYLLMKRRTWRSTEFDCRFDGVVYAVFTSLGFAILENIFYVFEFGLSTALVRAFTAIPGHACFGIFMGTFYAIAKEYAYRNDRKKSSFYRMLAVLIPVILHGAYDFIATMNNTLSLLIFIIFIVAMFIIANKLVAKLSREDHYMNWRIIDDTEDTDRP